MAIAIMDVTAMIAIIGVEEAPLLKALTPAEARAPTPSCRQPNREAAVPAFLEKGARHKAAAFGLVKPRQPRKRKRRKITCGSPYHPAIFPMRKITPTATCPARATRMICSLLYFRSKRVLNWLRPIKATDKKAKIHPYTFLST
jgi:hypothetical protein